jgi:NAD(P)-binding Rossmann-like domain
MADQRKARSPAPSRVAILGAGPVGLEAALAACDAGWPFTVYESAPQVGGNVTRWEHVGLFTPWSMNVSERMARHLRSAGKEPPKDPDYCPNGAELVSELLQPLAELPELAGNIALGTHVLGVAREGLLKYQEIGTARRAESPFRIVLRRPGGEVATATATMVLDCTGTYRTPNASGDGGVPAPGEHELGDRIVRELPNLVRDWDQWAGQAILLLGEGKSAQTAARDLAELVPGSPGTRVIWAVRRPDPTWGEVVNDPLPLRQRLADSAKWIAAGNAPGLTVQPGLTVDSLQASNGRISARLRGAAPREITVDRVLSLTGYGPDTTLYRELQVHECYATAAPMGLSAQLLGEAAGNCLDQPNYGVDVLRLPEPNFFLLGAKSYGRNSQFLMRIGYQQVSDVACAYDPGGP